jgi:exopolyphosphatase/pppGpp-phosphohydrolase
MKVTKGPPRISTPGNGVDTTAAQQQRSGDEQTRTTAKKSDVARRTLEKLGQKVSHRPAPEVAVEERAGKTAALRVDVKAGPKAGTWAAIDLGSSSAKMLVMRVNADGSSKVLVDAKIGAALGKDVVPGEDIPAENQKRALDALTEFLKEAAQHGVQAEDIPMITTAVVRNAPHGADFVAKIHALGLERARVLSGDEEANMGFTGALTMMNGKPGRYATLDLGGGSFQLAMGSEKGMEAGGSTQLGSNIILDELLAPVAAPDGRGTRAHLDAVDAALETKAPMPLDVAALQGRTLVATGGVSKFLRAHFGKDVISRDDVDKLRLDVISLPYADRVAFVQAGKDELTKKALGVETEKGALDYGKKLPASASLLLHILEKLGVNEVRVSETDSRHALINTRSRE